MRFRQLDYMARVDSTSDYLKAFIESGKSRMAVAEEQTGGRGRFGRSWHSPAGMGLYASYLCFPAAEVRRAEDLTRAAALGVVRAIGAWSGTGAPLRIKLPNDVLLGGRKCAGILIEMGTQTNRIQWAIIGIGVNLFHRSFPDELGSTATSLSLEGIHVPSLMTFFRELTRQLERTLSGLEQGRRRQLTVDFQEYILPGGGNER